MGQATIQEPPEALRLLDERVRKRARRSVHSPARSPSSIPPIHVHLPPFYPEAMASSSRHPAALRSGSQNSLRSATPHEDDDTDYPSTITLLTKVHNYAPRFNLMALARSFSEHGLLDVNDIAKASHKQLITQVNVPHEICKFLQEHALVMARSAREQRKETDVPKN